jgi:protein-arginine kinase activator protein McsA
MDHTLHELKSKTVAQLREIAKGIDHDSLKGYSVMHKDHLVPALCKVLGIDTHEHHQVVGLNKAAIKAQIKELKGRRDKALAAHDYAELKAVREKIHHLKRMIHKATV